VKGVEPIHCCRLADFFDTSHTRQVKQFGEQNCEIWQRILTRFTVSTFNSRRVWMVDQGRNEGSGGECTDRSHRSSGVTLSTASTLELVRSVRALRAHQIQHPYSSPPPSHLVTLRPGQHLPRLQRFTTAAFTRVQTPPPPHLTRTRRSFLDNRKRDISTTSAHQRDRSRMSSGMGNAN